MEKLASGINICITITWLTIVTTSLIINALTKGSPTVAKSRTPYLKSHLKSLKFQNLKSRTLETVISKFPYNYFRFQSC